MGSPKYVPEEKQASPAKPVGVTSSMSLPQEKEVDCGGIHAPPVPPEASNTGPVDFLLSIGSGEVMHAFVSFMSVLQVRGCGFKQRV